MTIEDGDTVTFEYTARVADGPVFDTTRESVAETEDLKGEHNHEYEPFTVTVGAGEVIQGIDEALVGMEEGEETTIEVPPEKGYGERTEDSIEEHETARFKEMLRVETLHEGMQVRSQDGDVGEIVHAGPETVRVDFDHDLAGETLEFDIEILDVR